MDGLQFWLAVLVGSYVLVAVCLVMLGQPVQPVRYLLKATTFWYAVSWVALGIALVVMRL